MVLPRLRQVALVATDLSSAAGALEALGLSEPFVDRGVGAFGLENRVYAAGDTFLEVVAPVADGTTAGRLLERRGPGGYMAIFQVDDVRAARARVEEAGARIVWQIDLDDMSGTHLHPKDVPGAIVSLDWANPAESWRWAGPAWTGGAPDHARGGVTALTVEVGDPLAAALRWSQVVGLDPPSHPAVELPSGQLVSFVAGERGIVEVVLDVEGLEGTARIGSTVVSVRARRAPGG